MNKDVIYIEPEDDITDILEKIKKTKNKIVALVPPKKAGVLRSAVNIKLIAKTAARSNKTTVLISSDESLMKLAMAANIPVAKTLQSKPQIPKDFSRLDMGEEPSDVIEAKKPEKKDEETAAKNSEKLAEKADDEVRPPFKTAKEDDSKKSNPKENDGVLELDSEDLEEKKSVRGAKKALPTKVPNFKKYLKFIIAGGVLLVGVIIFIIWTQVSAHADINVKIKTSETNFAEKVTFVTGKESANPEEGIFYVEQKTVDKKVETEFEATGELDKGQKATGTIQVIIKGGSEASWSPCSSMDQGAAINAGATFVYGEVAYKATGGISASVDDFGDMDKSGKSCRLKKDIVLGTVSVEAVENGDKYNIAASTSGWSMPGIDAWYMDKVRYSSSEMTGGSSDIVKVVSKDDIEKAKTSITMPSDDQIREELASEFDSDYLIIKSSLTATDAKYTSNPDLEGEVKGDQKPKLTLERSYSVYAVKRADVNAFITKKALASIDNGDTTQTIYSTGVSGFEKKLTSNSDTSAKASKDAVFFDSYKNQDGEITAKLKSVVLTAPEVTEEKILEIALGNKKYDVSRNLKSTKGVSEVTINTKPFSTIPKNAEKVTINIELVK